MGMFIAPIEQRSIISSFFKPANSSKIPNFNNRTCTDRHSHFM